MKNRSLVLALLIVFFSGTPLSAAIDLKIPLDFALGYSEIPLDKHKSYSTAYPYLVPGPISAQYIFQGPSSKWEFGAGASILVFPYQALNAEGSAHFIAAVFPGDSFISLDATVDLGILTYFYKYWDVTLKSNKTEVSVSPLAILSLEASWHSSREQGLYAGGGFCAAFSRLRSSVYIPYTFQAHIGYRFATQR